MTSIDLKVPDGPSEQLDLGFEENSLEMMKKYFYEFGNIFRIYSPYRKAYTYVISDPEMVKHVFVNNQKNYIKGVGIERVKILLGNGIMVSEGQYWRRQRRMIQPSFHKKMIEGLHGMITKLNLNLLEKWKQKCKKGEEINITSDMSEITLQVVLESIFGKDLERTIQETGENPFSMVAHETNRDLSFAMKFRGLSKLISTYINNRIAENRSEPDFLTMLMEAIDKETNEQMTEKELLDEVMTLIVAGHETTASTLNWTWYLLATHQDISEKLYQEINRLNGNPPEVEQLPDLNYNRQVIQESMRLYPPGWLLTRRALQEDFIEGYHVPPKTDIFVSPWLLHRNPEFWENPDEFHPDRFTEENISKRPKYSYFPFAAGPRQCIGDSFALFEIQIHLALMAQYFKMMYNGQQPVELAPLVNLRSKSDIFLQLKFL